MINHDLFIYRGERYKSVRVAEITVEICEI